MADDVYGLTAGKKTTTKALHPAERQTATEVSRYDRERSGVIRCAPRQHRRKFKSGVAWASLSSYSFHVSLWVKIATPHFRFLQP